MSSIFEKTLYKDFPTILHPFLNEIFENKKYLAKKIKNYLLNLSERKHLKSRLKSYPHNLVSDPTNICNLRCPLCPTWQDREGRPKGRMSRELFRTLIDEAGPYLFTLNLCNWGEPLLNPELPEMIAYAKNYNTVVGFSTNLNTLSESTAEAIAGSGLDVMVISLDGASVDTYSKYRRGGSFEAVIENIERLLAFKKEGQKFPLLIWQFLVNKYNEKEIQAAKAMAEKKGAYFLPSPMRTSMGKELLLPLHERIREMKEWLPENPLYNKYPYEITPETRTQQKTCKWLWTTAVVNWDGSVSPCCGVFEKSWDFGTFSEGRRFHDVWNTERYLIARKMVGDFIKNTKRFEYPDSYEELICSKCIRYGFLED
jgi:MoaA/NifB/PqqE/SkfB family radical SAM enzyme